ncbi:MAG: tRNA (cytidine(34)-2'-O)-methyltransferase [Planctomycetota bacterium]
MLHVTLYQPEIPPNTGNIARQCVGMNAALHLVGPMGFDVGEKAVRRAGLDYWDHLDLTLHEKPDDFLAWLDKRIPWVVSKFGKTRYDQPPYRDGDVLLFGNETSGLPEEWRRRWEPRMVYVPIMGPVRSYNLANTVSVVLAQASLKAGIF